MARGRAVAPRWVPLASPAQRPLAAAARAVKPPPPESMTAAAVVDARCGGSQRTPQRPQQQHRQRKPRQQRRQRQRQCNSNSRIISVIISSSGSSGGSSSSFSTVGRRRMQAAAACISSVQSHTQRMAGGGRESRVPWRSAVGRSRPTAALRARRCAQTVGARTMPTMHCACALTAVHRVIVQSSLSRPRTSHCARPTVLVLPRSSLRAHPCALTAPRATAVRIETVYVSVCYVRPRIRMSRSLPQSILFS